MQGHRSLLCIWIVQSLVERVPVSTSQATRQLQQPKPSLNDSLKDEYDLSLLCINDISGEHVFTNDYNEYEQDAAKIIVKNKPKTSH